MSEPSPCLKCEEFGAPTEGMTGMCSQCAGVFCSGHLSPKAHNCSNLLKR